MATELLQLLRDARDLIQNLGLGEYGYMDPDAATVLKRIDAAVADLTDSERAPRS